MLETNTLSAQKTEAQIIAYKDNTIPYEEDLEDALLGLADTQTKFQLANNEHCPPYVLDALSNTTRLPLVKILATNSAANFYTLLKLAAHKDLSVRMSVAENTSLPVACMYQLARDESVDVRYALAENYYILEPVLELLSQDENPYVACRAQKTLGRLRSLNTD